MMVYGIVHDSLLDDEAKSDLQKLNVCRLSSKVVYCDRNQVHSLSVFCVDNVLERILPRLGRLLELDTHY